MIGWGRGRLLASSLIVTPALILLSLCMCVVSVCELLGCLAHTCHTPDNHLFLSSLFFLPPRRGRACLRNLCIFFGIPNLGVILHLLDLGFVHYLFFQICDYHIVLVMSMEATGVRPFVVAGDLIEHFQLRHQCTFLYNHRHACSSSVMFELVTAGDLFTEILISFIHSSQSPPQTRLSLMV